jgi:MOSC domain-containing protein YiiM
LIDENISTEPHIFKLSISEHKGEKKENVPEVEVIAEKGIQGDAHCGTERPVSLLSHESFAELDSGLMEINPGDFAENITTRGLDYSRVSVGSKIALGDEVIVEVIQIGKECHDGCIIKQMVGDCIMPRRGVFARPLRGGILREGDRIKILDNQ